MENAKFPAGPGSQHYWFFLHNMPPDNTDSQIRQNILCFAYQIYQYARRFAKNHQDLTFELRLALGLARSFATSTRFILDKSLARAMFYRSRYIIERVVAADLNQPEKFNLPVKEIFIG